MRGLDAQVAAVLDRRLLAASQRPIALGLSGGGDSLALLLMAHTWAQAHGRRLLVLTVDHGLNPQSAAWTNACAARAERLGAEFQALDWTGPKPATGLPAAARAARHRLLADAARGAGARVLLLGHTADDGLEAQAMRRAGSTARAQGMGALAGLAAGPGPVRSAAHAGRAARGAAVLALAARGDMDRGPGQRRPPLRPRSGQGGTRPCR